MKLAKSISYEFELCKKSVYKECKRQFEMQLLADFVCSKSTLAMFSKSTARVISQLVTDRA